MVIIASMVLAAASAWLVSRPPLRAGKVLPTASLVLHRVRHRWMARRHRSARRVAVRDAVAEVVADVRAGQPPARALERALGDSDLAPSALAAVRLGGDVPEALRTDAARSLQPILAAVGACWSVAATQGAGFADALDRLVTQERRAEEVRRELDAHLAAPRATARMLALLPALGIGLGLVLGGDPLGWLLGTTIGWACLALGLVLVGIGLGWASRIARRTERLL
ncbi:MAG: type II secretion system F family protein [Candidatus Nanopelagicales bacterium]